MLNSLNNTKDILLNKKINFIQNLEIINENFINLIKKNKDILKIKKDFEYLFYLKELKNKINFTKIQFLTYFLTKQGKIKSNKEVLLPIKTHRLIAKLIRNSRINKLIPFKIINII